MTRPKRLSTVFRRALVALGERGWHKGSLGGAKGPCCVLGLVALGCGVKQPCDFGGDIELGAHRVLGLAIDSNDPAGWNDHPKTRRADVVKALKRAEALALERERGRARV